MNRSNSPILTAEALASRLNNSLPVFTSAEDVSKHPDLSHLLEDLTHHVTPTYVTKSTYAELSHATQVMQLARQKYLQEAMFHHLMYTVIYKKHSSPKKKKCFEDVRKAVALAEIQSHLHLLPWSSENDNETNNKVSDASLKQLTFGITPEVIDTHAEMFDMSKYSSEISSEVESHLIDDWMRIAGYHDPTGFESYDVEEVVKIPETLEISLQSMTEERQKLVLSITQTDYLFLQVRDHLVEYGNLLEMLMSKQRFCQYPTKHTESLYVQLSALLLKLKCMELEILLNTYTSSSVPALKYIHSHIRERIPSAERNLARLKLELGSFGKLDTRFKSLLVEYAQLQGDIEVYKSSLKK
ncbi:HAUS augmin-like complex subunit 4 [Macrobrachium rosenbergii]|uniref:HAUS augmin-like complex subunit 4 n=1 Tax=Macrobrachium rosenbergii TaxID=79674 RepID=UPI0034D75691